MFNLFKRHEEIAEAKLNAMVDEQTEIAETIRTSAYSAYKVLVDVMAQKKATKADLTAAIEEAIGHLGEILAE